MNDKVNGGREFVTLALKDESITLGVNIMPILSKQCKSVSLVMPIGEEVLIAEYGYVGLMELLTSVRQRKAIAVAGALAIVGYGQDVPAMFKLGMKIIPKNTDPYVMRPTLDPNNHYSFEFLSKQAEKDPNLLAAVAIANEKDNSRIGLNMASLVVSPEVIEKAEQLAKQRTGNLIYKDRGVIFVNYKLTHHSNIGAIIYDN